MSFVFLPRWVVLGFPTVHWKQDNATQKAACIRIMRSCFFRSVQVSGSAKVRLRIFGRVRCFAVPCAYPHHLNTLPHFGLFGRWPSSHVHFDADRSLSDAYGATWDHTLFRPLYSSGPPRPAVHVVATIASSAEYRPDFEDAAGWRAQHTAHLPELNHWVSLSSEYAATAHESAVAASAQLKQTAWQTRDDAQAAVELAQAEQVPGQEKTLVAEVKTAFNKVGINRLTCTS